MNEKFDYDNDPRGYIVGIVVSCLACPAFYYWYDVGAAIAGVRIPAVVSYALSAIAAIAGVYFFFLWFGRKQVPHHIALTDTGIEAPVSRQTTEHALVPFSALEHVRLRRVGDDNVLDLAFPRRQLQIREKYFLRRDDFAKVRAALQQHCAAVFVAD